MKSITVYLLVFTGVILKCLFVPDSSQASYMPTNAFGKVKAVNKAGVMSTLGVLLIDTFSVPTATPTIQLGTYIRANGYTKAASYAVVGYLPGAIASTSPNVSITGFTDTTVSIILTQSNTATVTILGINVLSGLPMVLVASPTNYKLIISAYLY